jgi:heat shock protein HslJ
MAKRSHSTKAALALLVLVAGCAKGPVERRLTVGPEPVACTDAAGGFCIPTVTAAGDEWNMRYNEIAGFDYVPGFTYEIRARDSEVTSGTYPSQRQLELIEVVSREPAGRTTDPSRLDGTRWTLSAIVPGGGIDWAATGITLAFDPGGGRIGGDSGCNQYHAGVTFEGRGMTVGPVAATRRFCAEPPRTMERESVYLEVLGNVTSFTLQGNTLTLIAGNGTGLVFNADRAS